MEKKDFPQDEVVYIDRQRRNRGSGKLEKTDFPQDPLERCQEFWSNLFHGILKCLYIKDPNLGRGLERALEREGLDSMGVLLFVRNPSDELLERSERFKDNGRIPKLGRGKEKDAPSPLLVFMHYQTLLHSMKGIQKLKFTGNKRRTLRERLQKFTKTHPYFRAVSNEELANLCELSATPKRMALELIAKFYKKHPENIDKILDQFSKDSQRFNDLFKKEMGEFMANYFNQSE